MLHEIIKTVSHSAVDYFNDEKRDNFNDGKRMEANVGNICLVWEGPYAYAKGTPMGIQTLTMANGWM